MGRASQFIAYCNIRRLSDYSPIVEFSKSRLSNLTITDEVKQARKDYQKMLKANPYAGSQGKLF